MRTMISHPMEAGIRHLPDGSLPVRNIVRHVTCHLNRDLLFEWFPETAISQNPYLEFRFLARASGTLILRWIDDREEVVEVHERLDLA